VTEHRFELVIFDCDGVLIDSEPIVNRVHAEALSRLGYPLTAEECTRRFAGMPDRAMYDIIETERGVALPSDYDAETKARIAAAYRTELRAIPEVEQALSGLSGRLMCVASSSLPDKMRLGLELVGLYERFAPHLFSASMVARGKPAPDLFLYAAERMTIRPERCVVVEDSVAGVTAARAAAMTVLGFTGGGHCGPDDAARLLEAGARVVFERMALLPTLVNEAERS